jgi:cytochrome-b5 reductase
MLSLIRTNTLRVAVRSRGYTTTPQAAKSSNLPLYLGGAGILGLGSYLYLDYSGKAAVKRQEKSPLDPANFVDFKLKKVEPYNHNTAKFIFELPNNEASLLPVTSCLVVKSSDPEALVDAAGKPIIRPYTPISAPDVPGELTLLVKKYENGNASKHIHSLKPGDKLAMKGPIPKWPYKINEFDEVALIGGGSGITPLYQVITHALADKTNKTKFTLLFSNVTEKDILLKEELDALKNKYPKNLDIIYVLDHPEANWTGPKGFISTDLIKKFVAPASLKEKVKVFVCGPPGQVAAVAGSKAGMKQGELGGILKELGYTEDQVFKF